MHSWGSNSLRILPHLYVVVYLFIFQLLIDVCLFPPIGLKGKLLLLDIFLSKGLKQTEVIFGALGLEPLGFGPYTDIKLCCFWRGICLGCVFHFFFFFFCFFSFPPPPPPALFFLGWGTNESTAAHLQDALALASLQLFKAAKERRTTKGPPDLPLGIGPPKIRSVPSRLWVKTNGTISG